MPFDDDTIGDTNSQADGMPADNKNNNADDSNDSKHIENATEPTESLDTDLQELIRRFHARPTPSIMLFSRRIQKQGVRGFMHDAERLLQETHEQLESSRRVDNSILCNIERLVHLWGMMDLFVPNIPPDEYSPSGLRRCSVFASLICRFESQFESFFQLFVKSEGGWNYTRSRIQTLIAFEQDAPVAQAADEEAPVSPRKNHASRRATA